MQPKHCGRQQHNTLIPSNQTPSLTLRICYLAFIGGPEPPVNYQSNRDASDQGLRWNSAFAPSSILYSQINIQSSGENHIGSLYLPDCCGCPDSPGKRVDAPLPSFPLYESFCSTRVSSVDLKTLSSSFLSGIKSMQMPMSATTWHLTCVLHIY